MLPMPPRCSSLRRLVLEAAAAAHMGLRRRTFMHLPSGSAAELAGPRRRHWIPACQGGQRSETSRLWKLLTLCFHTPAPAFPHFMERKNTCPTPPGVPLTGNPLCLDSFPEILLPLGEPSGTLRASLWVSAVPTFYWKCTQEGWTAAQRGPLDLLHFIQGTWEPFSHHPPTPLSCLPHATAMPERGDLFSQTS